MILIAHRAGTDRYPEQCMDAVRFSLANGSDMVEVDVRFTKDFETPVVCHDANVQRVFGVEANVSDLSLEEFQALRQVKNQSIGTYTLKNLLSLVTGKVLLHIKMTVDYFPPILRVVHESHAEERVVMGIEYPEGVPFIKRDDPRIRILSFMHTVEELESFLATGCEYIRLWEPWLTQKRITRVHQCGKRCGL